MLLLFIGLHYGAPTKESMDLLAGISGRRPYPTDQGRARMPRVCFILSILLLQEQETEERPCNGIYFTRREGILG